MAGKKRKSANQVRIQEGNIHICFRGNARNVIFYDDQDCIVLLKKCNHFASKHETKVLAFVIMNNHAHFQVITSNLTTFMREFLSSYSRWYNKKYEMSNQVFSSPFMSVCKYSEEWVNKSIIYILNNPVKAGICKHPGEFPWTSYNFYFKRKNPLKKIIQINSTYVEDQFRNKIEFEKALESGLFSETEIYDKKLNINESIPTNEVVYFCQNFWMANRYTNYRGRRLESLFYT